MPELKTHSEIIELINEVEEKFSVNDWKAGDIYLWPFIRISIFFLIFRAINSDNKAVSKSPISSGSEERSNVSSHSLFQKIKTQATYQKNRIKRILTRYSLTRKIKRYFFLDRLYSPASVVFFSFSVNRTALLNKWYNRQVDPLLDFLVKEKVKSVLFELHNGDGYKKPKFHEQQTIELEQEMKWQAKKIVKQGASLVEINFDDYENCLLYIKEKTKINSLYELSIDNLLGHIKQLIAASLYLEDLLLRKKTKLCFVTCYYDLHMMAVCVAANKLGIPVIDLQHGVQGEQHVAYGRWSKVPCEGYQMMPSAFWCWSNTEAETIRQWSSLNSAKRVIIGGNPWLALWKDEKSELVQLYDTFVEKIKLQSADSVHILYSMQPISDALPACIIDAIVKSPANWKWWIRLHPRQEEQRKNYESLLMENCSSDKYNFYEASALPLPALLRHTQIHVTNWSSVTLEAAEFKVPSIIIHRNGVDLFKELITNNIAFYTSGCALDIIVSIRKQLIQAQRMDKKLNILQDTLYQLLRETLIVR